MKISDLNPKEVWGFFEEVTKVPRPSKKEGKIIAYLEEFAKKHSLDYKKDKTGNVVIFKPATEGKESSAAVILQSHMDMVCEKNSDVEFDFDNDPIQAYVDDEWVGARGTTLGADCGIGIAAALAVLASKTIAHPAIEALFTVDEETGLTGAFNLGEGMISGKYLINLDSEDEGEIFIGCAGGIDTVATFEYNKVKAAGDAYKLSVKGLLGGHSGDDIEKGRANANKVAANLLWRLSQQTNLGLSHFDGGNLRNAIPREAEALFVVPEGFEIASFFEKFRSETLEEFAHSEPNMNIMLAKSEAEYVVDCAGSVIYALQGVANGVLAMSQSMHGLVETSSNLASVKFTESEIVVTTSQRSSIEGGKYNAMATIESIFVLAGAEVVHSDGYPGWAPDPQSNLLKVAEAAYHSLFARKAKIRAIHAGLECGLFLKKHPQLQMISVGPTLRGVHSPDERLKIATVGMFYDFLVRILSDL